MPDNLKLLHRLLFWKKNYIIKTSVAGKILEEKNPELPLEVSLFQLQFFSLLLVWL